MKKRYSFIYSLVALLLVTGCTNEPLVESSAEITIQKLNASMADLAISRSHLENGTSVVWDSTDKLGVFSDTQNSVTSYSYFAVGDNGAVFSGDKVSGNTFYSFYPYSNVTPDGSRITSTLEPEFWYKENTYTRQCPMVAKSMDHNFKFLQTCGIVKLSMTGTWRLTKIVLKGNNNEVLAGTGTIDAASDAPVLTIPADAPDAGTSLLMHTDVNLVKDVSAEFYFIVPAQTFTQGLTFTITGYLPGSYAETVVTKSTNKQVGVSRAVIKSFTAIDADDLLAEETDNDRITLMAIYNALGGANWTNHENWGSDKPINQWHGVQVENNHVTSLYLDYNNLTGTIPSEIGNLTQLKQLYLSSNNLTGTIPSEIGNLTQLKVLCIGWNNLTGTIPSEIGNLTQLKQLYLSDNNLEGTLPVSMNNLTNLENIEFSYNKLSGDIPSAITSLPCWSTCGWANVVQRDTYFNFSTLKLSLPVFTQNDLMTQKPVNSTVVLQEKELTIVYLWDSDYNYSLNTIKELHQRYKNHGLNVLAINADDNVDTAINTIKTSGMEEWYNVFKKDLGYDNWNVFLPIVAVFDKTGEFLFNNWYQNIEKDLPAIVKGRLGEGESLYTSTDFSKDGTYEILQKAEEGNGINIVLMGDAYSDRLIADGTYETTMKKACEAFFSEQPYTDFRNLFNVYYVNVVSVNEEYREGNTNTALKCTFGEGTYVEGDWDKGLEYAKKIPTITDVELNNTLIIVMMNSTKYAGTCHMEYFKNWTTAYGEGKATAYFPVGDSDEALSNVLHHEAGGHGFGKLADEYFYDQVPGSFEGEKQDLQFLATLGWYKNVDVTADPTKVHWSKFISDSSYGPEKIGVYEGAYTYAKGFYRPTETSIMLGNTGGFNAPSREIIYYRIHKLAYGGSWVYNYEEFKNWDTKNIHEHGKTRALPENFVPLAPPVVKVIR